MPRQIFNLGLDADTSFVPYLDQIETAFGALGYPKPLLLCYTKIITPAQLAVYKARGFPVALIFEVGTDNSLGGESQGVIDGKKCVAQMKALGAPPKTAVYLTTDRDVESGEDLALVEDYWAAGDASIFTAGFRIGGYADGTELQALHSHGLDFQWLAGASGWDGYQAALGTCDILQGVEKAGKSWMGIQWPVIPGLDWDADIVYAQDVGQIMPVG